MNAFSLVARNLHYHFRTNLPVSLGCAVCASVLAGALLVGDSMRGSLRAMTLERLGSIESVSVSSQFFPIDLADRIEKSVHGSTVVPAVMVKGTVAGSEGKQAYKVNVIGAAAGFWGLFPTTSRSEERRVGKEGRARWG